jgi:hypothetical protein
MKTLQLISIIKETTFRPFTKTDWYGWAGCESKEPWIGESPSGHTIILDGETVTIHPPCPPDQIPDGRYTQWSITADFN